MGRGQRFPILKKSGGLPGHGEGGGDLGERWSKCSAVSAAFERVGSFGVGDS